MKIEFRKLPTVKRDFSVSLLSVKFEGTFCKISSALAKFETKLSGQIELQCSRCGDTNEMEIDEDFNFLVSDRVYKNDQIDELIIEINDEFVDFDEIIQGEVASMQSEYYLCTSCKEDGESFEKEY
ncbi:MAG: hypothetical protein HRT40_06660 [Campylobacteraceae bacterium]|nr:hypothetical protein [Campylobacteraceae bacterium]